MYAKFIAPQTPPALRRLGLAGVLPDYPAP